MLPTFMYVSSGKQRFSELPSTIVPTNQCNSSYRPRFFDLEEFNLSQVDFSTSSFNEADIEKELLSDNYSFAFLRDGELRTIRAYDREHKQIGFSDFLTRFNLKVESGNIFKCGKYLSRVFRPVKYGKHYRNLEIYVNSNPEYAGKITDGLSLISIDLAKSLGWSNVKADMSAQFTLLFNGGLVKGNCVVSDKITHDVVIYTDGNIKREISLTGENAYVSVEPLKLSRHLRMDIQSMLNLWQLFGADQYLEWAYSGIQEYKKDLLSGNLNQWLDNFEDMDEEGILAEQWTLRKAIWHQVDYTRFPGLIRLAWTMFRNSLVKLASDKNGLPAFRIPVPNAYRGYFRVDLRNHDGNGNFKPTVEAGTVCLDNLGNLWIHPEDITEFLDVKGGGDLDDNGAIIPVSEDMAIVYRNPNQYGEYGLHRITYDGIELKGYNRTIGKVPFKKRVCDKETKEKVLLTGNPLLDRLLSRTNREAETRTINYSAANLIRTYARISRSSANIGVAANAEMLMSAIGITNKTLHKELMKEYNWNLERIIDSTVKDGTDAEEDMAKVHAFFLRVKDDKIAIPKALMSRVPDKMRAEITYAVNHPADQLLEAVEYLIKRADIEVLGEGSVSKGNRIKGLIDELNIPFIEIGRANMNNPMTDIAVNLMKQYNKGMAILLGSTKELPINERELKRKAGIEQIQAGLLNKLSSFTKAERELISQFWAYEIYKTDRAVHDSILWIGDKEGVTGTGEDTIRMLCNTGIGSQINKEENKLTRAVGIVKPQTQLESIRLWSKNELNPELFSGISEIKIENGHTIINEQLLNLGDENKLSDGLYKIKTAVQSTSRKNKLILLKNSITLYIETLF